MTQAERYERAQRDPNYPHQVLAIFRLAGTLNDNGRSFDSLTDFRAFIGTPEGQRYDLRDYFIHKARYGAGPRVNDYNDGYHTMAQIQEAAAILGYCTAKPYDAPLSSLSIREIYERREREAYDRYLNRQKSNTKTL